MIIKNWFWVSLILSILALSFALIAEHFFNIQPCSMCLNQRYPYYFIIFIFLFFYLIKNLPRILYFISIQIASIYGLFYSFWHVGIEQKILKGPESCAGNLKLTDSAANLKEQILGKAIINCEDVIWSFFGISAATLNTILLLFFFIFNILYLNKYYAGKKK